MAEQAIAESAAHDRIVHLEWGADLESDLLVECEGNVDANGVTEYWGTTEDGAEWRVHLTHNHAEYAGDICTFGDDGTCTGCGVSRSVCPTCEGIGYHREECAESEDDGGES